MYILFTFNLNQALIKKLQVCHDFKLLFKILLNEMNISKLVLFYISELALN